MKTILVTGGAGFIGSNFIRYMLRKYPDYRIINLDKLTYAGNLENLRDIEKDPRYEFVHGDICDPKVVDPLAKRSDAIINFAALTHVDRSIMEAGSFIQTDVYGAYVLLEAARKFGLERMVQVSSDETYGSIEEGSFKETAPLAPNNPYSASKAGGDLMAHAYYVTFGVPVIITRGSNNFGPFQYPEKLIPLFITNAIDDQSLPLYGDGMNVRDWIYVLDHCEALDLVLHEGDPGEIYNIGAGNEMANLTVTRVILGKLGKSEDLIRLVKDRPGHDRRYSLDCSKIKRLGWIPRYSFEEALESTVRWYVENQDWWRKIKDGSYRQYYEKQYGRR